MNSHTSNQNNGFLLQTISNSTPLYLSTIGCEFNQCSPWLEPNTLYMYSQADILCMLSIVGAESLGSALSTNWLLCQQVSYASSKILDLQTYSRPWMVCSTFLYVTAKPVVNFDPPKSRQSLNASYTLSTQLSFIQFIVLLGSKQTDKSRFSGTFYLLSLWVDSAVKNKMLKINPWHKTSSTSFEKWKKVTKTSFTQTSHSILSMSCSSWLIWEPQWLSGSTLTPDTRNITSAQPMEMTVQS